MRELMHNRAQFGWLVDPGRGTVHVYRAGEAVRTLLAPNSLSGEPLLPGFVLDLRGIL
jgi:Uma2 family endonuclease